jgi:hypothetical protein
MDPPPTSPAPYRRASRLARRLAAAFLGAAVALVLAELALRALELPALARVSTEYSAAADESPLHPAQGLFVVDPELGYRPSPDGPLVDAHGCAPNDYPLAKPAGTARVLFVGDSVTRRGALVDGLRQAWGADGVEYWNAGVEGYGLHQTERYHLRFLAGVDADHVVLTFHMNDFSTTPVAFLDGDRLVVHDTKLSSARTNRWLFQRSLLYRLWLSRSVASAAPDSRVPLPDMVRETEAALVALRDRVEAGGARFSVVLLPWLLPTEKWPEHARVARREALAMLARHRIATYDLADELAAALADGEVVRERHRDPEHPSQAFGLRCGLALRTLGLAPR